MTRWWKAVVLAAVMSVMLDASTQAQVAPAQNAAPPVKATPVPKPAAPQADAPLPTHPELDMPDTDTAKRLDDKIGDEATGGADCRNQCAKTYYMCLSTDDGGQCSSAWAKCLTACPTHSSNF